MAAHRKTPEKSERASKKLAAVVAAPVATATHVKLSAAQRALLPEALRRADETRNAVEDALVNLGRWLLVHVFADDAAAVFDKRRDNALWLELLHRAGGPTLRLSKRLLYVAVSIAAHDKRIQDESWRLLEAGRKEILLPLRDERELRRAAQHVVSMKLSTRATRDYVRALLAERLGEASVRVHVGRFQSSMTKFRARVVDPGYQKQIARAIRGMPDDKRAELRSELTELREWASAMMDATRGK